MAELAPLWLWACRELWAAARCVDPAPTKGRPRKAALYVSITGDMRDTMSYYFGFGSRPVGQVFRITVVYFSLPVR